MTDIEVLAAEAEEKLKAQGYNVERVDNQPVSALTVPAEPEPEEALDKARKDLIGGIVDKETSVDDMEATFEKALTANALSQTEVIQKASEKKAENLTEKSELKDKKALSDAKSALNKSQTEQAASYFEHHKQILGIINITAPLSLGSMKFFFCVATAVYLLLLPIDLIITVFNKTFEFLGKTYKAFMEFVEVTAKSTNKAVKAVGWLFITLVIIAVFVGAIWIALNLVGIDIFEIIKNNIAR